MSSRIIPLVVAALALAKSAPAAACPFCYSETGQQVRSIVFADDFVANAAAVLAPFLLLATLLGVIHFAWPASNKATAQGESQ